MSGSDVSDALKTILERWGLPTLACIALGYFLRNDLLKPLVAEHTTFLRTVADSQQEIAKAMGEQTRLLYTMQSHIESQHRIVRQMTSGSAAPE